jgi:hypothetical protein
MLSGAPITVKKKKIKYAKLEDDLVAAQEDLAAKEGEEILVKMLEKVSHISPEQFIKHKETIAVLSKVPIVSAEQLYAKEKREQDRLDREQQEEFSNHEVASLGPTCTRTSDESQADASIFTNDQKHMPDGKKR